MNQAGIQAKINLGYGKAATYLGASCQQYRPTSATNPISDGNLLGTLLADFDINPAFTYRAPAPFAKPIYYGLFDATNVLAGDYLIAPTGTWYVGGLEPNKPPLCVRCNRTVTITRPNPNPPGNSFYSGDIRGSGETTLLEGWPASVLQGTRGEKGPTGLPGDTRMPFTIVLFPAFPGVTVENNDRMSDDLGDWHTISSVELTNMGWRLTAILTNT